MNRWDALSAIVAAFPTEPYVVTLGGTTREIALQRRGQNHLYVLDSMGLPPAIGLGLALGLAGVLPDRIVVLEGDGSLLMGFSSLATIGLTSPANLLLIVLDNGTYAATGNQPTAASAVDFVVVAAGCGIEGRDVATIDDLCGALAWARGVAGPILLRVRIDTTARQAPFLLEDPVLPGADFARYLEARHVATHPA
ncbi:MAG: phosphonopyruvate decarboxylase [Chloroflexi bacterium]|nr:phosphonopyruvate decarboxylase [Chloroflexota bacterium]